MLFKTRIFLNLNGGKKFMAFFSNGEDKLKLMILFTLECAEMPLSREQIATVMSENGVENYFDVCEHIIDLEANGCIASVPTFKNADDSYDSARRGDYESFRQKPSEIPA